MDLEVKSIQGTGTRVQSGNVGIKKGHVGVRKGGTVNAAKQMGGRIMRITIVVIVEKVKIKVGIGGRRQGRRVNEATSGKVSILHKIIIEAIKINIIKLKQKIRCRMPKIGGGRQL
jgi:hypothetical protein